MKTLTILTMVLGTGVAVFAMQPQDEAKIKEAIRGLGSENFEEREKAATELRKAGAPALEALKKAADESDDPEVRARAKRLVQEIEKPAKQKGRAPGLRSGNARLTIRQANGDVVYTIQPEEGEAIEFRRSTDGAVKLTYPDGKGGKAEASADSLEKFLADQKALAEKYGISKEGIDYGGTRLSFSARRALPAVPRLDVPELPGMPGWPDLEEFKTLREDLRRAFEELNKSRTFMPEMWERNLFGAEATGRGLQLTPVPGVLRSQLAIPEGQGVVVESVREGSAADAAGLKRHDVILEIDGNTVSGPADVRTHLKRESSVKVLRSGKEQTLKPEPGRKKEF
ncbi:MAG TPA: PDZ domain-containing protein [Planctomycetota bacterium]|nr:PDZ domain-containing protein [Planctomycetota bacterium]